MVEQEHLLTRGLYLVGSLYKICTIVKWSAGESHSAQECLSSSPIMFIGMLGLD